MTHHPQYTEWKCTVPPSLAAQPCKLPSPHALIRPPRATTTITPKQFESALERAVATWNATGFVRLALATDNTTAEIIQTYGPIDVEGKILAYSTLPCNGIPVLQKYDARERWDLGEDKSAQAPSLWLVIAHELGHALGMDHLPAGNIMAPYYHEMSPAPGEKDLQALAERYDKEKEKKMTPSILRILLCLATGGPAILECLAKSEILAAQDGRRSPLMDAADELRALRAELRAQLYGAAADPTQTDPDDKSNPQP